MHAHVRTDSTRIRINERRRTPAQTCGGLKPWRYDRRGANKRKCFAGAEVQGKIFGLNR